MIFMTDTVILEIVKYTGGSLLGVIGLATVFFKSGAWKDFKLHTRRVDFVKRMESLQRVYGRMIDIQTDFTSRVLIFSGHDSGGLPRVGSPFWVTVLHWVAHPHNNAKKLSCYENVSVDLPYISMLVSSLKEGMVFLTTSEMPECLLKTHYQAEGVSQSLIIYLGIRDKSMFYMSVARYTEDPPFATMDLARIKMACQPILNEFEAYARS